MMARKKLLWTPLFYTVIMLALSACNGKNSLDEFSVSDTPHSYHKTPTPVASATPVPTKTKKDLKISSPTDTPAATPAGSAGKKATDGKEQEKAGAASADPAAGKKPDFNVSEPFDASKPKLMGFTLNDSQNAVVQRFGSPAETFKMDDPDSPISVYQYPGFSIGFDGRLRIVFIQVSSAAISPGLNGFHLGQKVSEAIDAIGKPDAKTDYVMSYISGGVVLKLDIDPADNTVTSIKLFSASE